MFVDGSVRRCLSILRRHSKLHLSLAVVTWISDVFLFSLYICATRPESNDGTWSLFFSSRLCSLTEKMFTCLPLILSNTIISGTGDFPGRWIVFGFWVALITATVKPFGKCKIKSTIVKLIVNETDKFKLNWSCMLKSNLRFYQF
jgi:hypothetical protein